MSGLTVTGDSKIVPVQSPPTPEADHAAATPLTLTLLVAGLCAAAPCSQDPAPPKPPPVQARVDPRIELLSLVFRLAGNPEYTQARIPAYAKAADLWFAKHKDHAVVRRARDLRRRHGVSYDAVMAFAVHLADAEKLEEAVPFDPPPPALDKRWKPDDGRAFLADLRAFVKETRFAEFMAAHQELHALAAARAQQVLDAQLQRPWFDTFFGVRPGASFALCLGLLNGPANYGPRVRHQDGTETLYCVLGVWKADKAGEPAFDASMLATVAHEFCHSYCNPLIEQHERELEAAGSRLYSTVADKMRRQAYGDWQTMLKESLVRACVVRSVTAADGERAGRKQAAEEKGRGFTWVPELAELLARYEQEREKWPTLQAFMPEVVAFFGRWAEDLPPIAAAAPQVVATLPANRAKDVDPKLTELKVTFDRPMQDGAWAFVRVSDDFPKTTGKPSYDAARQVVTLPVALEPGRRYELWLNRGKFSSFQSAEGVLLPEYRWVFQTRN